MDLYKITLLTGLLLAIFQVKGFSWNKHITHIGDMGFRALHSMTPEMQLNQRTTIPVFNQLSESQEGVIEDILPELDHFLPHSGDWSSKKLHKPSKRSPEVNHRDEQTLPNCTKGHDDIVDTDHEVVRGLNDEQDNSDIISSHQILFDVRPETNTVGNINQIIETESDLDDSYVNSSNKSTKLEDSNLSLINIHERDKNVMTVQSETESTMAKTYDNVNITSDNSSLKKASLDILVEIETTEYSQVTVKSDFRTKTGYKSDDSVTNERNKDPHENSVNELVHSEDSVTENYSASERIRGPVPAPMGWMHRSLPGDNKAGPNGQEVIDKQLKNAQRKIPSRNQYRQQPNPAALHQSRYKLVTSRDKFQPKYYVPKMDQVYSGPNYFASPADQRFSGNPGPNSYTPQHYDEVWLNKFGSIPAFRLHKKQNLFSKFLAKPPQQLSGYGQSLPRYINARANDPLSASLYKYIQTPYTDGVTFGSGQFGGIQYGPTNTNKRRLVWKKPATPGPLILFDLL